MTDSQGKPDFEAMMEKFQSRKSNHRIQYCVFGIIYFEGKKLTMPLYERNELLDSILDQTETVVKIQWMYGNGEAYFDLVKQQGLEGIVLKRAASKYQVNKRSTIG